MTNGGTDATAFSAVVIGAGVVGGSCALFLSERGLPVALLDAGGMGEGTSGNSFAWINATSKTASEPYHRLNARGAAGYRELAVRWGEARIGLHPSGMLQFAGPGDVAERRALEDRCAQLRAWDYPAVMVGESELRALEPHVRFAPGAVGLYAVADGWLDVPTYLRFARERIEAAGGAVMEHTAAAELLLGPDGEVKGVGTEKGVVSAPRVIFAAGPSMPRTLGALTGHDPYETRFPMQRAAGLLVRTPPLRPHRLARRILYANEGPGLHVRPTPDGGLLLGADDTDGAAEQPEDRAGIRRGALTLLERARALIPGFPGPELLERCELKIGVRPMPADGVSIAGALPRSPGAYLAVTHSGVTLGPAIGALLAEEIETGTRAADLVPFGFERFQQP